MFRRLTGVALAALSLARPAVAACTKDTDCKGARVCEKGKCVDPPAPTSAAYEGALIAADTQGHQTSLIVYLQRTLNPAQHTISERMVEIDAGKAPRPSKATLRVDGAHFTFVDGSMALTGEGTLVGPAWKWTSWSSKKQAAGQIYETNESLTSGGLAMETTVRQPSGAVVLTLKGTLEPLDAASFEKAYASATAAAAAPPPPPPAPTPAAASASSCQGGAGWDGNQCVCPGGTYDGRECVCLGGQVWTGQQCACPGTATWNGNQCTCHGGSVWDGSQCSCPAGQSWNGLKCECPSLSRWNGSQCMCVGGSEPSGDACSCPGLSQWNGAQCQCPSGMLWHNGFPACVFPQQ